MKNLHILCLAVSLLIAFGCDKSPTEPASIRYSVRAQGVCGTLPSLIQCREKSVCTDSGNILTCGSVEWEVIDPITDIRVGGEILDAGSDFQKAGLLPGPYTVTQEVSATNDNGSPTDRKTYNVEVPNPLPQE